MRPFRSQRPTIADLLARKGKCQLTQVFVRTLDEATAAEAAGIEMVNLAEDCWTHDYRAAMPQAFVTVGLMYGVHANADDYIRAAFAAMRIGADAVYSAASIETISPAFQAVSGLQDGIPATAKRAHCSVSGVPIRSRRGCLSGAGILRQHRRRGVR